MKHFVKTPFGSIHTLEAGSGKPVIFLHGLFLDAYACRNVLRVLSQSFRIIIPTLPGWHPSMPLETFQSPEATFQPLGDWLDATRVANVTLIGHSLGGVAAVHLALQRPKCIQRLILVDTVGIPIERSDKEWHKRWLAKRLRMYRQFGLAVPRLLDRTLVKQTLRRKVHLHRMSRFARTADIRSLVPNLPVPLDILWGTDDEYTPSSIGRTLAALKPGSTFTEVPGDHDWPQFQPEPLLHHVLQNRAS